MDESGKIARVNRIALTLVTVYFFPPSEIAPPPAFASFLAFSAARFSSFAFPPFGLFFSALEFGLGLNSSLGGIVLRSVYEQILIDNESLVGISRMTI